MPRSKFTVFPILIEPRDLFLRVAAIGWSNSLGVDSHSFQPSFFSKTSCFPRVLGGFPETRIPGQNGEATLRIVDTCIFLTERSWVIEWPLCA